MPPADRVIEFWFDFASPYAYFAAPQVPALASRHGRAVVWRPFLLGVVFRLTGMLTFDRAPMRGDYARRDWDRLARWHGVPFVLPPGHPPSTVTAARALYWVEATVPEAVGAFARAVFDAAFAEGRDLADADSVVAAAARCGLDGGAVLAGADRPEARQRLRAATDEAIARGIFGAPFVIVDGEPFWGADRLPMVDAWLARGGW